MKIKIISILLLAGTLLAAGCTKKSEEANCKTCTAFGPGGTTERQVCSEAEEATFRSENAGKEISCH